MGKLLQKLQQGQKAKAAIKSLICGTLCVDVHCEQSDLCDDKQVLEQDWLTIKELLRITG